MTIPSHIQIFSNTDIKIKAFAKQRSISSASNWGDTFGHRQQPSSI
jgi:hypothetical protein